MRTLTVSKRIYLLLIEPIFTVVYLFIVAVFANKVQPDFFQKSILFQAIIFIIISFIYINAATINKKLCIASSVMILKMLIGIFNNLVLPNMTTIEFFKLPLSSVLEIVIAVLDVCLCAIFIKAFRILF
jgi:hypothetical protein